MKMNNSLKALSKSTNDLTVGNYIVLFGGRDLVGEYFTRNTKFESPYTDIGTMYVDFEHGADPDGMGIDDNSILGVVDWKSAKIDEKGVFVERVLSRRAQYVDYLSELIDAGVMGTSSEAVRGKVSKTRDGEITVWPLKRDSLTLTPMEPRMVSENILQAAKALREFFPAAKSLASVVGAKVPDEKTIETIQTLAEAEDFLRDTAGLSKAKALAFVSRVKSLATRSDSAGLDELKALLQRNTQAIQP
jgi:hypothetical protein